MADSLRANLEKAGFVTVIAEPDVKSIEKAKEETALILHLTDISRDEQRPICVIGYEDELEAIKKYIPQGDIKAEFKRPFDPKYVAEGLKEIALKEEEKLSGKLILLVDDDTTFLKMLKGWLSGRYRITAVKSGIQAITYMANHRPDLILLD